MNPVVEAWIVIEKLAALIATPDVSQEVKTLANEAPRSELRVLFPPSIVVNQISITAVGRHEEVMVP